MTGLGISYILFYKDREFNYSPAKRHILLILLGLIIFLATTIRDGGIVLLIAAVLQQVISWIKKKSTLNLSYQVREIALLQFSYWIPRLIFERILPLHQESHYDRMATANLQCMIQNMTGYVKCLWEIYPFPKVISIGLLIVTTCIVAIGIMVVARDCFFLPLLYAAGTLALYCIWPVFIGIRFGFSAFMALLIYVSFALKWAKLKCVDFKILRVACMVVPISIVTILGVSEMAYIVKYSIDPPALNLGPYTEEAEELFEFINSSTQENEIIVFQKPRAVYLNTGRLGMQVDYKDFNEKLPQADYIIDGVESDLGDFDVDVLNQYDIENESIELSQVFANDKYTMFKIYNKKM